MATVMTNAQRTHADKALAGLEQSLTAVLSHGVGLSERDQLTAELTEIRSQRQALGEAHPNEAYRWTKAATARTKKFRRKYPLAHTSAQRATGSPKSHRSPHCTTPTPHEAGPHSPAGRHGHKGDVPLVQLYTAEHRQLIRDTATLLLARRAQLHRSAGVTTGTLRTAIKAELEHVVDDLRMVKVMSYRKVAACMDYHQRADEL